MTQIPDKNKEGIIKEIPKYLFLEIQSYIPFNTILNFFRYNKTYQKELNLNLFIYQKWFIKNRIKFDFIFINNDKLFTFLQKEFNNFTRVEDKESLIKIRSDFANEKKIKENISNLPRLIGKDIEYEENIIWKEDKYSNYLNLGYEYICHHGRKFFINDKSEQAIIPSQCFPNVCVISADNNFIIPASMMENLIELDIRPVTPGKVLFYMIQEKKKLY